MPGKRPTFDYTRSRPKYPLMSSYPTIRKAPCGRLEYPRAWHSVTRRLRSAFCSASLQRPTTQLWHLGAPAGSGRPRTELVTHPDPDCLQSGKSDANYNRKQRQSRNSGIPWIMGRTMAPPAQHMRLKPRPCTPIFIMRTCRGGGLMRPPARLETNGRRA